MFAAALTGLLVLGMRRASELQAASAALQIASELSAKPEFIRSELTLVQRGLETQTYIGQSLRDVATARETGNQAYSLLQGNLRAAGLDRDATIATPLAAANARWASLDRQLQALAQKRDTELYADDANGSELSASGRKLKAAVDDTLARESQNITAMTDSLTQLGIALRASVTGNGRSLRELLLGGTAVATLLLGLMLYFAWRSRQSAAAAADAQRQVTNILGTVREGLFLIGRDLRLSATCSDSLTELLRIPAPAGQSFEALLQPLVDDITLKAALKFLGLLWKDRVHEDLIESVNPLNQIEVSFASSSGGSDTRYLAFSFRRVRGADTSGDYILGVVADVTDRVMLARELEHVKADNDSQAALLLQLLKVDAAQLQAFLSNADVAFRKSNAMLTAPGKEQEDLKKKLNGVFRELHAAKGEAAALGLNSFVQRIHAVEDTLATLRARTTLTGNDFLPVVVKLDELMTHVASIQAMQERVAAFRSTGSDRRNARPTTQVESDNHADTTVITESPLEPVLAAASPLETLLRSLTADVSAAQSRPVRLVTRGLEQVPSRYAGAVKDICIQMIRNAIVHGIEAAPARAERGKVEQGTVQISFAADSAEDYLLTIEDDGRGLGYEQIIDKALRLGLVRPQQAMALERVAVYRLIFQPGFSTVEQVSEHAGRGVGLDAVTNLVRDSGGKIGVSTVAGQYTRFKVLLPKATAQSLAASSAA